MQAMTQCEPEMREKAYRLCRDFLSGAWRKLSSDEIVVKRFSGGMSNLLYFCALPNSVPPVSNEPRQVLLRIYGQVHDAGVEAVITQSVIFTLLSERRMGPKLYGVFPGGRLEEYIPARHLETKELTDPSISAHIAEKLAKVHRLQVPITKEPTWLQDTMLRWLQQIRTEISVSLTNPKDCHIARKLLSVPLEKEYEWVMAMIAKVNSPVIFSHNDLQEGNILVCEDAPLKEDRLVFIDYEYCSYNYRGFDLANHFCEWCYDYSNPDAPNFYADLQAFPTKDQQLIFIRPYLRAFQRENPHYSNCNNNNNNNSSNNNTGGCMISSRSEELVLKEVFYFTAVSHFFWTLWGIVNGANPHIEFGYWDYALSRLDAYFAQKARILAESGKRKANSPAN